MANQSSKTVLGQTPAPTVTSALVQGLLYEHVTTAVLAAGELILMGPVAPGVKPVDVTLIPGDLDTNGSPTITLSVGFANAGRTDLDTTFIAASTAGQTGVIARATTIGAYTAGSSAAERMLAVKVVTGPATSAAAGARIAVVLDVTS